MMKKGVCGVYKITSPSGKFYIGSSVCIRSRFSGHKRDLIAGRHHGPALQKAANKHGVDSLKFDVLLICDRENVRMYEQRAIDILKPEYNSSPSATDHLTHKWEDPEFRRRVSRLASEQSKRLWACAEFREKHRKAASKALSDLHKRPEFKEQHAKRSTERLQRLVNSNPDVKKKAEEARLKRFKTDFELRKKLGEIGRKTLESNRQNKELVERMRQENSERMKARRADPEERARNLAGVLRCVCKPVMCVETGYVFEAGKYAGQWASEGKGKTPGSQVSACMRGVLETAFGFHWEPITREEYETKKVLQGDIPPRERNA